MKKYLPKLEEMSICMNVRMLTLRGIDSLRALDLSHGGLYLEDNHFDLQLPYLTRLTMAHLAPPVQESALQRVTF